MRLLTRHSTIVAYLFLSGLVPAALFAQNVSVRAVIEQGDIYVGDPFKYQIVLNGVQQPAEVDTVPLQEFQPSLIGSQDASRHSVQIINGRRSERTERRYLMTYQLTSSRTGSFTLPALTLRIDGRTYRTNPITVNVLEPGTSEGLLLEMELDQIECYVGQPVRLTLNWLFYSGISMRDLTLSVPPLNDQSRFFSDDPQTLAGKGDPISLETPYGELKGRRRRVQRNGKSYDLISLQKVLMPRQSGTLNLDPATLSCNVAVGAQRSRSILDWDPFARQDFRRFQARSQGLTLQVKPLPQEGRPANFQNLIGRYKIDASAEPVTDVNVGDPILLKVNVSGDYLNPVSVPDLAALSGFEQAFRLSGEPEVSLLDSGVKRFTYTLRPQSDQITEIPAVPLSFFDVDQGAYVTVMSDPITLQIMKTKIVSTEHAVGTTLTGVGSTLQARTEGIAANYYGPELLKNRRFTPMLALSRPVHIVALLLPALILAASGLLRMLTARDPAVLARRRRARAASVAVLAIRRLSGKQADSSGSLTDVAQILRTFIADRFDRQPLSITARDCYDLLRADQVPEDRIEAFCALLEQCEAGRYGGTMADPISYDTVLMTINSLESRQV